MAKVILVFDSQKNNSKSFQISAFASVLALFKLRLAFKAAANVQPFLVPARTSQTILQNKSHPFHT